MSTAHSPVRTGRMHVSVVALALSLLALLLALLALGWAVTHDEAESVTVERSGVICSPVGVSAVLTLEAAQSLPRFQTTTLTSPGAYVTSSQRNRYSYTPFFRRPCDLPLTKSSASSPEVKT